jgi:hypothetical protein
MFSDPIIPARVFSAMVDRAVTVTQHGNVDVRVGMRGNQLSITVEDERAMGRSQGSRDLNRQRRSTARVKRREKL